MAVSIATISTGTTGRAAGAGSGRPEVSRGAPEMGVPVALFQPHILYGGMLPIGSSWQYDVAPDGRFLINVTAGNAVAAPITVIQNWTPKK
jgi:hypothetical protein